LGFAFAYKYDGALHLCFDWDSLLPINMAVRCTFALIAVNSGYKYDGVLHLYFDCG
jgi:hypothetical protein